MRPVVQDPIVHKRNCRAPANRQLSEASMTSQFSPDESATKDTHRRAFPNSLAYCLSFVMADLQQEFKMYK